MPILKSALKAARTTPLVNLLARSTIKAGLSLTGARAPNFLVAHLYPVGRVRARLPNGHQLFLQARGGDWCVTSDLFWRGWTGYEPETTPLFYRLACDARVTLDVGAHIGFHALLAAHANPASQVYAFEPMPLIYQHLQANIALNGVTNVECVNRAVSDAEGEARLFSLPTRADALPSCASLMEIDPTVLPGNPEVSHTTVSVVTLDGFLPERGIGPVDLLKIDVELAEAQVLRGMARTLDRGRPDVICEVVPWNEGRHSMEESLRPLGYRFYHLTPDGPVQREQIIGDPAHECRNYLFSTRPPDAIARLWRESQKGRGKG